MSANRAFVKTLASPSRREGDLEDLVVARHALMADVRSDEKLSGPSPRARPPTLHTT
jgi:hypothetical protein